MASKKKQARPPQPEEREKEKIKTPKPSFGDSVTRPDQLTFRAGHHTAHRTACAGQGRAPLMKKQKYDTKDVRQAFAAK
jgi:hypothetical protein